MLVKLSLCWRQLNDARVMRRIWQPVKDIPDKPPHSATYPTYRDKPLQAGNLSSLASITKRSANHYNGAACILVFRNSVYVGYLMTCQYICLLLVRSIDCADGRLNFVGMQCPSCQAGIPFGILFLWL